MLKHRCRYKIIGTGIIADDIFIETDLICPKCGKTGTVYVNNMCEKKLIKQASNGKYFNIHRDFILTDKQWKAMHSVLDTD